MSSTATGMKKKMKRSSAASSSAAMAFARIGVGIMFLFFGEYKVVNGQFAHEGYTKWVSGFVQESAVSFYKPFLKFTLQHHVLFGYTVGWVELLIGISMVLGLWVRPFAIVAAIFMLQLVLATWNLPAGTASWRYAANELEHIPMLFLFLIFFVHGAGETLGLDGRS
jgi:uncharacterized membrane protein YphA (DoxX/SURF4 family)